MHTAAAQSPDDDRAVGGCDSPDDHWDRRFDPIRLTALAESEQKRHKETPTTTREQQQRSTDSNKTDTQQYDCEIVARNTAAAHEKFKLACKTVAFAFAFALRLLGAVRTDLHGHTMRILSRRCQCAGDMCRCQIMASDA